MEGSEMGFAGRWQTSLKAKIVEIWYPTNLNGFRRSLIISSYLILFTASGLNHDLIIFQAAVIDEKNLKNTKTHFTNCEENTFHFKQ